MKLVPECLEVNFIEEVSEGIGEGEVLGFDSVRRPVSIRGE